jgi:hypothetical protein
MKKSQCRLLALARKKLKTLFFKLEFLKFLEKSDKEERLLDQT